LACGKIKTTFKRKHHIRFVRGGIKLSLELLFSPEVLKDVAMSLGILLVFLIFRKIFAKYVFSLLLKISKKAPNDFYSFIFLSFEKPIQWLFIIIGINVAANFFPYFNENNPLFLDIMRSAIIILISWGLYNISAASSGIFSSLKRRYNLEIDDILIPFISRALRFIIVVISISVIAEEFDYDVSGFVAGLGLGGVAIAFAAKDVISQLFGGFVIITEKPFKIGDWIMTPNVEGTVEEITFRSTIIRTFEQALVTMPNATIANQPITNWSKMGKRRVQFNLVLSHDDTSKEKLQSIIKQIEMLIKKHPDVHPETISVTFDHYMENGYDILIYFFTKTTVREEYLKVKEEINFEIMEIVEAETGSTPATS
jgi:MscS family membrane protein